MFPALVLIVAIYIVFRCVELAVRMSSTYEGTAKTTVIFGAVMTAVIVIWQTLSVYLSAASLDKTLP